MILIFLQERAEAVFPVFCNADGDFVNTSRVYGAR